MTPAAPASTKPPPPQSNGRASTKPPPPKTGRARPKAPPAKARSSASTSGRTAPARRRKQPGSPRGPIPRRVSGPVAAPALQPKPDRADRRAPRRRPARKPTLAERLAAFLRSLPDHPLLDRLVRGRAWIPVLGVMLVGIIAMQVELLKLNADTGRSIELIGSLQGRNDLLRAQVASASDPNRIERLAGHMGMTMPSPGSITFVKARSASVRGALARIAVPNLAAFEAALRASEAATSLPTVTPSPSNGASTSTPSASTGTSSASTSTPSASTGTPSPAAP